MSDIKLKIRHAKRSNDTYLDLSGQDMSDIPIDVKQLTMLERLNLANNKLTDISRISSLPNLKEVHAGNNNISSLP
jgi:internalin A